MGGSQSNVTIKNTFLEVDTSQHDGATKDPRKIQSYSGPVRSRCKEESLGGSCSEKTAEGNDSVVSTELADDWITEKNAGGNDSLVSNELADDWITDTQRLKTDDSLECGDLVPWTTHAYNADAQEHLASATHAYIDTTLPVATAPTTKQTDSFWSSWNISDANRKKMQERAAFAATGPATWGTNATWSQGEFRDPMHVAPVGMHVSASAQLPPHLTSNVSAANDNSKSCKPKRFTTNPGTVPTEEKVTPANAIPIESWTCRMLRNIPNDYTRSDVLHLLDSNGLSYDFVYLPVDWRKNANLGYAFVNFVSHEEAENCAELLNGYTSWRVPSEKVCEVVWGKEDQQGLHKNIDRFRNSPVMHPDMPDEFKPLLFTLGQRTPFPAPTERLKRDRRLSSAWWQTSGSAAHSPTEPEPEPREANV